MLNIDLTGRRALVAGVADDGGLRLRDRQGARRGGRERVRGDVAAGAQHLPEPARARKDGRVAPALVDGELLDVREDLSARRGVTTRTTRCRRTSATNKRYKDVGDCSIDGLAQRLVADFGERPLDIVVHSLANGPEVKKPLLEVSRNGYLGAVSASAYSLVSMVQRLGPLMREDGSFVVAHVHGERARDSRLRRRHVVGEGGAGERHAHAGVRGGSQVWRAA